MPSVLFVGAPTVDQVLNEPDWRPGPIHRYEYHIEVPFAPGSVLPVGPAPPTPLIQIKAEPESQPLARFQSQLASTSRQEDSYANSYAATQAPAAALPHNWRFRDYQITEIDHLRSKMGPGSRWEDVELCGFILDITPPKAFSEQPLKVTLGDDKGSSIELTFWAENRERLAPPILHRHDIVWFKRISLSFSKRDQDGYVGPKPVVGSPPRGVRMDESNMQICWSFVNAGHQPRLLAAHLSPEEARVARLRDFLERNGV